MKVTFCWNIKSSTLRKKEKKFNLSLLVRDKKSFVLEVLTSFRKTWLVTREEKKYLGFLLLMLWHNHPCGRKVMNETQVFFKQIWNVLKLITVLYFLCWVEMCLWKIKPALSYCHRDIHSLLLWIFFPCVHSSIPALYIELGNSPMQNTTYLHRWASH